MMAIWMNLGEGEGYVFEFLFPIFFCTIQNGKNLEPPYSTYVSGQPIEEVSFTDIVSASPVRKDM